MSRKRYRYILNGCAMGGDAISDFRLIAGNNILASYPGVSALRVVIPDDLELTKYRCDPYSTTTDGRTLEELGYDVMIWNGKRWEIHNKYKDTPPHDIYAIHKEFVNSKSGRLWQVGKEYAKMEFPPGSSIEQVVDRLLVQNQLGGQAYAVFNGVSLYSDTVTVDEAYKAITGMSKAEFDIEYGPGGGDEE